MSPTNIYATSSQEVVGNADLAFSTAPTQGTRTYYSPYHMHGSIGPSCAVANVTSTPDANGIRATVWSGTQGVYPLQQALSFGVHWVPIDTQADTDAASSIIWIG
jgi:nicotinate dehydrogenase subunit B